MKRYGKTCGIVVLALGVIILLSLILPAGTWWFLLGLGMIAAGICILRH